MKNLAVLCLFFFALRPAVALEGGQVLYVGGTTPVVSGTMGSINTTSETALTFEYPSGKLTIPYADIVSFEYSDPTTHHLGVLPAIAVGLLAHQQHRHLFSISYRDEKGVEQVAILEVPGRMVVTIHAVLDSRGPKNCRLAGWCRQRN
jgi:hypothetical protein